MSVETHVVTAVRVQTSGRYRVECDKGDFREEAENAAQARSLARLHCISAEVAAS